MQILAVISILAIALFYLLDGHLWLTKPSEKWLQICEQRLCVLIWLIERRCENPVSVNERK